MVTFDIETSDYVRSSQISDLVFRVDSIQLTPPDDWRRGDPWYPRAWVHYFGGGTEQIDWAMLARWERLEHLDKLNEMEVIAISSR